MSKTSVTLSCSDKSWPRTGRAYIARITGRDARWTFSRDFVSKSSYMTDEKGVYEVCDIDRKGRKDQEYWLVEPSEEGLVKTQIEKADAMKFAKLLDTGMSTHDAMVECWDIYTAPTADPTPAILEFTEQ